MTKKPKEFSGFPQEILDDPRWKEAPWRFRGYFAEAADGDTIWALEDEGKRVYQYQKYRVLGYDAPELFHGGSAERSKGKDAQLFLAWELFGKHLGLITQKDVMSADRWLVRVLYVKNGEVVDLADVMRAEGHIKEEE